MPFSNMARKAHRHLIDLEYDGLEPALKERHFEETFDRKVEPGLLGARPVGNIYTGSVYMGLISLLETEKEKAEGKRVGIFSYGSGCGAEFFLCQMKSGIGGLIRGFRFRGALGKEKEDHFRKVRADVLEELGGDFLSPWGSRGFQG